MCSKQNKRFESKRVLHDCLTKHISCVCKSTFDDRKRNLNQKWNNVKFQCECKNLKKHHVCEKDYIFNPATCNCENDKYLERIIDDSVITCDEIIDTTKIFSIKLIPTITVPTKSIQGIAIFYVLFINDHNSDIKNRTYYYFDDIIKFEGFDLDNDFIYKRLR